MNKSIHKHVLYEASVQDTDVDINLINRMTRRASGKKARTLREDFCGTAILACDWVRSRKDRESWGIDLHHPTLEWAKQHRLPVLGEDAERVHLLEENVLEAQTPNVDVVAALNFSYLIFKEREILKAYFTSVYESLNPKGVFMLDLFGGPHAQEVMKEKKKVDAGTDYLGNPTPPFTYIWDQAKFNAVNQNILCKIHFKGKHIEPIETAFTYDWRLWGLAEITDLLKEVGFIKVDHYFEGWDDETEETDGVMNVRTTYEDMMAWICYLGAAKG
jgi:cyclopropane fatty-acyl-phospholipid synthase-like methyltransferase